MKKLKLWAPLLALLVSAGTASAAALSDESLNKLLDLSGINKQVSAFPEMLKAGVDQAQAQAAASKKSNLTADDFKQLKSALSDAFQPQAILQTTGASVKKNVSEADSKELVTWFESDLGKKLTQAEADGGTMQARQEMIKNAQTLMADKERVAFAHKLDKLLHATDSMLSLQERMATAMYSSVARQQHPDQPMDMKALQQKLHAALEQNRPDLETAVVLSFVYTYRNIDMKSLNKYGEFLERAPSRHFNDSARDGMMAGIDQAAAKAGDTIAAMAAKKKKG